MLIEETIAYTRTRIAFGKPILDNQVVHFRLAELATEVEMLRALVYRDLRSVPQGAGRHEARVDGEVESGTLVARGRPIRACNIGAAWAS